MPLSLNRKKWMNVPDRKLTPSPDKKKGRYDRDKMCKSVDLYLDKVIESVAHKSNKSRLNTADIDAINVSGCLTLSNSPSPRPEVSNDLDCLSIRKINATPKTSLLTQMEINRKSRKHYLPHQLGLKPLWVNDS